MKRSRKRLLCTMLALASMVAAAPSAQAGPLFQGGGTDNGSNTFNVQSNTGTPSAVVSYAVINTGLTNGSTAYLAGLGATTMYSSGTGAGQYIYIYQVVNASPSTLGSLNLTTDGALYTAAGQISGKVFTNTPNGGGPVTGAGGTNTGFVYSSNDNAGTSAAVGQNYTVANAGAVSLGTAGNPSTPGIDVESLSNGGVTFYFKNGTTNGGDLLAPGTFSDLVFLVSNQGPTISAGELNDTNRHADGFVPVAAPEPQTYALMSSALIGLGGWAGWRRRFRKLS